MEMIDKTCLSLGFAYFLIPKSVDMINKMDPSINVYLSIPVPFT